MRELAIGLAAVIFFTATSSRAADSAVRYPAVYSVSGHLLDEESGQWSTEDVFGTDYVPFNKLETSLMVLVTIDLGEDCVMPKPSSKEAWAIANGGRPFKRPATCEKPPGRVAISLKYGEGARDRQEVSLTKFSSGADGKIRVPFLFYRRLPCAPLELTVQLSTRVAPLTRKVDFVCRE